MSHALASRRTKDEEAWRRTRSRAVARGDARRARRLRCPTPHGQRPRCAEESRTADAAEAPTRAARASHRRVAPACGVGGADAGRLTRESPATASSRLCAAEGEASARHRRERLEPADLGHHGRAPDAGETVIE